MKNYERQKYSGNENGWHEPIVNVGVSRMDESQAAELNSHFRNTGIKYVETDKEPWEGDNEQVTSDHGEPNLTIKDGKAVNSKSKPADKIKQEIKDSKEDKKHEGVPLAYAEPSDVDNKGSVAVKSDQTLIETEVDQPKDKAENQVTTAGQ